MPLGQEGQSGCQNLTAAGNHWQTSIKQLGQVDRTREPKIKLNKGLPVRHLCHILPIFLLPMTRLWWEKPKVLVYNIATDHNGHNQNHSLLISGYLGMQTYNNMCSAGPLELESLSSPQPEFQVPDIDGHISTFTNTLLLHRLLVTGQVRIGSPREKYLSNSGFGPVWPF